MVQQEPGGLRRGSAGVCRVQMVNSTITPNTMLHYTLVFFIVAIIAAVLGFGVIAGTAALIAKICFFVFIVLALISMLSGRKPSV